MSTPPIPSRSVAQFTFLRLNCVPVLGIKKQNDGATRSKKKFEDIFIHLIKYTKVTDGHRAAALRIASRGKNSALLIGLRKIAPYLLQCYLQFKNCYSFMSPLTHRTGALCIDGHRLSVCLSVCPVPHPRSITEGVGSCKLAGRKPMTRVSHLEVERSRSPGRLTQ